jgi:sRNA-binding regulator protein Hfq
MTRLKFLSLAFMLVFVPLAPMVQAQQQSGDTEKTAKVKSEVARRVANKKTRVKVKLLDGAELKGRIEQADTDGFTITEDKTNKKVVLSYSAVDKVKGRGMGTGTKILIASGVAVGVLAIIVVVAIKNFDPFKGGLGNVLH